MKSSKYDLQQDELMRELDVYDKPLKCKDESGEIEMNANGNFNTYEVINYVALGTDVTNRIGKQINLTQLLIKGFFNIYTTAGEDDNITSYFMRLAVVYDKSGQETFNWSDVFEAKENKLIETGPPVLAPPNTGNLTRFCVLYDKCWCINSSELTLGVGAVPGNGPMLLGMNSFNDNFYLDECINLGGLKSMFEDDDGDIDKITQGSLFIAGCSNYENNRMHFTYTSRLVFDDY